MPNAKLDNQDHYGGDTSVPDMVLFGLRRARDRFPGIPTRIKNYNGNAIPEHIMDDLCRKGYAQRTPIRFGAPSWTWTITTEGLNYIIDQEARIGSFINKFCDDSEFTWDTDYCSTPTMEELSILFRAHPELIDYKRQYCFDVTVLYCNHDNETAATLVRALQTQSLRVRAMRIDDDSICAQRFADDLMCNSIFCIVLFSSISLIDISLHRHVARLMEAAWRQNQEFVLPVMTERLDVADVLKSIGHLSLRNTSIARVAYLFNEKLESSKQIAYGGPTQLTNDQRKDVLLWALYVTTKKFGLGLGTRFVLTNVFYEEQEEAIDTSALVILDRAGHVKLSEWYGRLAEVELTRDGCEYLKKRMAIHGSFIQRHYNKVATYWSCVMDGFTPAYMDVYLAGDYNFMKTSHIYAYDVALSFSGKDRSIATEIANTLKLHGMRVFFDEYEKAELWGKNLYDYLVDLYSRRAQFCIILISQKYLDSKWANLERQAAQERAFLGNADYILPVRIDDARIPGILETIGYVQYGEVTAQEIADMVLRKLESDKERDRPYRAG